MPLLHSFYILAFWYLLSLEAGNCFACFSFVMALTRLAVSIPLVYLQLYLHANKSNPNKPNITACPNELLPFPIPFAPLVFAGEVRGILTSSITRVGMNVSSIMDGMTEAHGWFWCNRVTA
jgi:hypothetical protein